MPEHACPRCFTVFNKKSTYNNHVHKRKYSCILTKNLTPISMQVHTINPPISTQKIRNTSKKLHNNSKPVDKLPCLECDKTFARTGSLKRHIDNYCKGLEIVDENLDQDSSDSDSSDLNDKVGRAIVNILI
jgi:uncharacterized C2H2 Zn-finger protein